MLMKPSDYALVVLCMSCDKKKKTKKERKQVGINLFLGGLKKLRKYMKNRFQLGKMPAILSKRQ